MASVAKPARIWFVSPVYYDAPSYKRLVEELGKVLPASPPLEARFVAVDDSGGADPELGALADASPAVRVVPVPFPLGHQRALVYGLRGLAGEIEESDVVVTLDADGEDQPADLPRLLAPVLAQPQALRTLAVASRTRRRETLSFKVLYFFFRMLFVTATGLVIRSGNYAAYRGWLVRQVLFHPHFDLCYSSSLLSLGLKVEAVPCERGVRYAGASKMTYLKLLMHGLRMLMPFADRIAMRGLVIFSVLLGVGTVLGTWVVGIKIFTDRAIPGWATYALLLSLSICATALACLILVFALFVQSESLSMSRLDTARGPDRPRKA